MKLFVQIYELAAYIVFNLRGPNYFPVEYTPLKTSQRLVSFTLQNAAWIAAEDQFDQEVSHIEPRKWLLEMRRSP